MEKVTFRGASNKEVGQPCFECKEAIKVGDQVHAPYPVMIYHRRCWELLEYADAHQEEIAIDAEIDAEMSALGIELRGG